MVVVPAVGGVRPKGTRWGGRGLGSPVGRQWARTPMGCDRLRQQPSGDDRSRTSARARAVADSAALSVEQARGPTGPNGPDRAVTQADAADGCCDPETITFEQTQKRKHRGCAAAKAAAGEPPGRAMSMRHRQRAVNAGPPHRFVPFAHGFELAWGRQKHIEKGMSSQ